MSSKFDPYEHLNVRLNPDGTLSRFVVLPLKDANPDPIPGVQTVSKDVTINNETKVFVRIYRPVNAPPKKELPLVIYLHGGGWLLFSANDEVGHTLSGNLSAEIPAVVVSVDYRHSPEHRLPAQYEDTTDALNWVRNQARDPKGEPWLVDYVNFSRCFLYGCSNGANIVYHAAFRALDMDLKPLNIAGLIMSQPMFGGNKRTGSELRFFTDQLLPLPVLDLMWELTLPKGTSRDHRFSNPMMDDTHKKKVGGLSKCLVIGFGGDPMIDRQQEFVKMLVQSGVNVEACFDDVGFHGVDLVDPKRAKIVLSIIKDFIAG